MKDRKPIKRISEQSLCSITIDIIDGYDEIGPTQEQLMDWDFSDEPEFDEQRGFENWIPYHTTPGAFFDSYDDKKVEVISWENGILITHIPMLYTLERFFFSRLVQLDFDEGINFCIKISENVEPELKKKFFIKLIEEVSLRVASLQRFVNDPLQVCEESRYGVNNLTAFYKLDNIRNYFISRSSGYGTTLPLSGLSKPNLTTMQIAEVFGPAIVNGYFGAIHEDKIFKMLIDVFQVSHDSENLKFQPFLRKIFTREKCTLPMIDEYIEKALKRVSDGSFKTNIYKK